MNLQEYFASLQGKTVAVIGFGVSNRPLVERLLEAHIALTICDKKSREALGDVVAELEAKGAIWSLGETYLDNLHQDVIFRTPGMRPDVPALKNAKDSTITSEMEVFFSVCPCPILAVTGSDGKTTTTTLIAELLKAAGHTVHVGGNIGHPLLCEADAMKPTDFAVLELSSFQLMTMPHSPHTAVMTNLAPNHLDYHTDMDEYVEAKANLIAHQTADNVAIFNADNEITMDLSHTAKAQVNLFSRQRAVENGVYLQDGTVFVAEHGEVTPVLQASDIRIPGLHNVENYMAAICAVWGLVSPEMIQSVAKNFGGVAHRIEWVRTLDGVRYYNDSIASSPSRTMAGLHAFTQKVNLIAGGYDKQIPFTELGAEIVTHVGHLILCGHTAEKIEQAVLSAPNYEVGKPVIYEATDLAQAVALARSVSKEGDVVTLSPACASFDQFPNFAARGDKFRALVQNLE
ncbi:UDP-N-acetylmuramoyl-L-alanine--D-glutamate ligase [Bengtsoniella intestinalis]|uniref:UDP-N-acetylmuramoyl-L-alanine--D-glutamate ligase n=1 Tax=Bengtsoniella intestinalis TaxID=3073143 RepID=UPI00391F52B8